MTGPRRHSIALIASAAVLGAGSPALGADAQLVRAAAGVAGVERSAAAAAGGAPPAVQALYDDARDLEEAARAAAPVSRPCRALLGAVRAYARGRVRQAEGVDRLIPAARRAGQRAAARARARVAPALRQCPGSGRAARRRPSPISPRNGEAFYGVVVARAPAGATAARLRVSGGPEVTRRVRNGKARFVVDRPPGRYSLRVAFLRGTRSRGTVHATGVWLLPREARAIRSAPALDPAVSRALAVALAGGTRYSSAWVQDLRTGRAGAVNAAARFPAASTVKLGMLADALPRLGPSPHSSPYYYDLQAMTRWSSNVATNRLVRRMGGSAAVGRGLRRLGARDSTFTGEYVVGTALQPRLPGVGVDSAPPRVSRRVTTAQDLAHMMFAFAAAATGDPPARRRIGMTTAQARLALGWLLSSEQRGDNRSLLSGGAPRDAVIAQKNGWLRAARHGAGVVFAPGVARIAIVLTYDARGVSLAEGRRAGARVAGVAARL
jgi:beta-lactamase class A